MSTPTPAPSPDAARDAGRRLMTCLHETYEARAVSAIDIGVVQFLRDEEPHGAYAAPLYAALVELAAACGWAE